ncbi:dynein regulation protein LC7 [Amycolatopsis sp. K13G38]|uniref:Dynein regulation protein LC7 n=1 Tax=Amycolatopsis acididurans TaxID=2724524 RepID=A0ABX1J6W5_9PSEU|nr:dynein regulation protein LC7 [Amycolatopsis acididurans]
MRALRERVPGITGTLIAAIDGLLVVEDLAEGIDPDGLSALAAAGLGLCRRTAIAVDQGMFRHNVIAGSGGYLAVYAIGENGLLAVLGDEGLAIERLHQEAGPTIDHLGATLSAVQPTAS